MPNNYETGDFETGDFETGENTTGIKSIGILLATVALVTAAMLMVPPANAASKCKVKIDNKTGVLYVTIKGVTGAAAWSDDAAGVFSPFFDPACVSGSNGKKCTVADPTSIDAIIPPASCTMHIADDGPDAASCYIKGCTPQRSRFNAAAAEGTDIDLAGSSGVISAVEEPTTNLILKSNSDVWILFDVDNSSSTRRFRVAANTDATITDTLFEVDELGAVYSDGGYNCAGSMTGSGIGGTLTEADLGAGPCLSDNGPADFAELLPAVPGLEPGDVLAMNELGKLVRADKTNAAAVMGVHSTRPSYLGNSRMRNTNGYVPLALVGIVPVKATAADSPIKPGDLLVASATPGHARACRSDEQCTGRSIGKAMQPLAEGTGSISMIVRVQ